MTAVESSRHFRSIQAALRRQFSPYTPPYSDAALHLHRVGHPPPDELRPNLHFRPLALRLAARPRQHPLNTQHLHLRFDNNILHLAHTQHRDHPPERLQHLTLHLPAIQSRYHAVFQLLHLPDLLLPRLLLSRLEHTYISLRSSTVDLAAQLATILAARAQSVSFDDYDFSYTSLCGFLGHYEQWMAGRPI